MIDQLNQFEAKRNQFDFFRKYDETSRQNFTIKWKIVTFII